MGSVGIVGGLGPESTIDYYRRILDVWQRHDPGTSPSIVIDSLDVQRALRLVQNDRDGLIAYLRSSIERLSGAGVDFIAMTANTPHIVFDELVPHSRVPMLSIVEVCAAEAARRGLRRLALLGTRFTMEGSFYAAVFDRLGIAVISPEERDRVWIHQRYIGELLKGDFRESTRQEFTDFIGQLRESEQLDGVILGGTELPLLLRAQVIAGISVLDTTALHVDKIVEQLRSTAGSAPR